jgi:hypothetical protein
MSSETTSELEGVEDLDKADTKDAGPESGGDSDTDSDTTEALDELEAEELEMLTED